MNQCYKAYNLRDQAKKINSNIYIDLLHYSKSESKKNPKNKFILAAKVMHQLNQLCIIDLHDQKYHQSTIEQCEKVLNEEPQNLHAFYLFIEKASNYNTQIN